MKSGWVTKKLGDVCEITMGASPDSKSYNTSREGLPFYQGKTEFGIEHPTPVKWCSAPVKIASMGDILLSVRAPIGPVNFANEKCCIGRGLSALRFEGGQRYLYYFLQANESELDARGTGTTFKCISGQSLRQIPIPIPPLAEQKRIVAKIDAAFEKIDALKANAEKNLANAKELFQSALDEAMRPKKGWVEKRLGEIGTTLTGMTPSTKDKTNFGNYMPFVKPADITPFAPINYREEGLSEKGVSGSRLVKRDSVLMVCIGSIGKTGYADRDCTCNQQINALTPCNGIEGRYLYYLLSSDKFRVKAIGASGQTTLPILSKSKWENLSVRITPSLEEQKQIIKQLDALSQKNETLQQNYAQQIADCAEMRQAILREAFEGRL